MDRLRCIIVDDEPLAVRMLENFVQRTACLQLEASFSDPVLALSEIQARRPQLVFLDIQMPDLDGLELSRMIPEGTRIIFTTAFKQYAFDSYEVHALDFLLKPIRYQKFLSAVEKAKEWFSLKEAAETPVAKDDVFVRVEGALVRVHLDDILYVAGMKDYVQFYLEGEKDPLVSHMTMKAVEEMLPEPRFLRVHRSYIVAPGHIRSVSRGGDISIGRELIHIGDSYREAFDTYLKSQ